MKEHGIRVSGIKVHLVEAEEKGEGLHQTNCHSIHWSFCTLQQGNTF